ncbi:MAG TPA: C25 family cysteine peptidase [Candidatus Krumholzibacteria bacterium]|nr:C25 family cysteine peptidase [Candidatus Krumholzibacteria bacterium]
MYFRIQKLLPPRARARTAVLLATLCAAGWAPSPGRAAAVTAPARLLQAAPDRVVFRVDVPDPEFGPSVLSGFETVVIAGFGVTGNPGEPPVPSRTFLVAIPPDGNATVSARVLESRTLGVRRLEPYPTPVALRDEDMGPVPGESVVLDESRYRGFVSPATVAADDAVYIRHQRTLPVRVNPLSYDPVSGQLSVATRIEVTVVLSRPKTPSGPSGPPRAESPAWEATFGRLFVNPGQASAWRLPRPEQSLAPQFAPRVIPGAVKLHVRETAVHRVTASSVIAAGFPAGQPLANLHLFHRGYDETAFAGSSTGIPFTVIEDGAGTAGIFDGNDLLVFYGLRLRDDAAQGDTFEQYSQYNVYWLEPAPGTMMSVRAPAPGFVTADTTDASFPATLHFETDVVFRDQPPTSTVDVYTYNFGYEPGPVDVPFDLGALKAGSSVTLSAELNGTSYRSPRLIKLSLVNANGTRVLNAAYPVPAKARRVFSIALTAEDMSTGTNRFRLERPNPNDNTRTAVEIAHNWLDISCQSLYRARGDVLRFNTATLAGDTSVTVTGLSASTGFELFDVTAPAAPVRVQLPPGSFQPVPGGFALSFRENIAARREFVLVPVSRMTTIAAEDIVPDTPSSIIGSGAENGVDVLVVSHAMFISQMQRWVSYRRAQGYRVLMVDVDDVYDEFNGGVPSPVAVFRFTRHFFERGNAGALVVVGDGSKDQKRIHADSGINFVPAFTRIDNVSSLLEDEVVSVDKRYVKMRAPNGTVDSYPDLVYGRIPVGSSGELDLVLDKTFKYEAPGAADFWRKRMIIVSDDTYSSGSSSFGNLSQFCNAPGEIGFRNSQERTAQTIENALPAGYDVVRFFLSDHTDAFYTTNCASQFAAVSYTRRNVTELLMNELAQGATLVTIQAHMNRSLITHESVLATYPSTVLDGSTGRDHIRVDNRGKPWIMFGMGCHFSEYSIHREHESLRLSLNNPNGDAFAEQFLFQNDRGAVGTYGSSGFEYLSPNSVLMEMAVRIWFYEAPYDTMVNQTQGQWVFGDLMYLTEAQVAGQQRDPVERYLILGDPLLRIDAGPPAFDVTVDGRPAKTGDVVSSGGEGDTIQVVAIVTDENAIRDFKLEIDGVDATDSLTVAPLVDAGVPRARQYRVSFRHKLRPENYDIVLRAYQAPDTLAGVYHVAAEFQLRVESSIAVSVNGRAINSGASVPADGKYRVDLVFPVPVAQQDIQIAIDDDPVTDASLFHPTPEDSLAWAATFRRTLTPGKHVLAVAAGVIQFEYNLIVSEVAGLRNVINFPNPFRGAGTSIVYTNDVEITSGTVDIYTVSGKRVRRLEIPPSARFPGQNSVFWDGRDGAGEAVANGAYLYVVEIRQRVGSTTTRGKMTRIE